MNLYHLTQTTVVGYDTYSDCVVAAIDEEDAKRIHPGNYGPDSNIPVNWFDPQEGNWFSARYTWPMKLEAITAKLIGTAAPSIPRGVICASFNAG